jgi:uncharacterized protein (TIGR00369 family)
MENDFGLQMKFYETGDEPVQVIAEITVPARFQGYPGIVHGGILAAMLDETISRTVMRGSPPRVVVTAKLSIRYRRPVLVEIPLRITGRVVEDKGRVIRVAGEITNREEILLAEGEAVLSEIDPASMSGRFPEQDDWKVYPDTPGEVKDDY